MKSSLLLLLVFLLWGPAGRAQAIPGDEVPPLTFVALQQLYPEARQVKWKRTQGWYQASYTQNQTQHLVRFDANGDVQATGDNIPIEALPEPVRYTLTNHFPSRKFCQANKVVNTHTEVITYEIATCESYLSRTVTLTPNGQKAPRTHRW
ncbi:hypothetical protein BEN47_02585 [Hymenobacter lapidarius]|uniref:Beta-lactamase-inhibitor-like PepSY-like domain-containing protein n=1 Tax=Hymenobacter lapidarius TaxID=1908237 RepID=A0A1G1T2Y9_9BACT|nr:hypothetical protein [Hymenobacter lapidarius]OGX85224.1 hypothetical protein BEN47_02585 [Hymenobacter lapidarius]